MHSSFTVALFIIGNIVGSGFFMLPPKFAPLGSNLVYSWFIAGSMAFIFAGMFCRLYIIYPDSSVLSDYFVNPVAKKVNAMVYWVSCIIGNTGLLVVIVANLGVKHHLLAGMAILLILTIINHAVKYSTVARIEALLTIMKFSILIGLPVFLLIINKNVLQVPIQGGSVSDIMVTGISCTWAYIGIETAGIFGSGPSARRGLIIGISLASVLYVATSLFIVACVPKEELAVSATPFLLLINKFGFVSSGKYINSLISFTALGALYGWIAATGKMSLLFAKSNTFPKQFLKQTKSDSSYLGLWVSSFGSFLIFMIVNTMDVTKQFDLLADMCVYITLALYGFCAFVLFIRSKSFIDYFIAFLSILSVIISFSLNLTISGTAILFIGLVYLVFLYFEKNKSLKIF